MSTVSKPHQESIQSFSKDSIGLMTKQIREISSIAKISAVARKTILISVGAVILVQETLSSLTVRCIDRGAELEADTKKYAGRVVKEILTTARLKKAEVKKSVVTVSNEESTAKASVETQDVVESNL
ncbi:MAG: hypothetical protein P1V97_36735 [Planctomycetota bacterium]|nr:hypothetical protein [Planctomycetota bacterium]